MSTKRPSEQRGLGDLEFCQHLDSRVSESRSRVGTFRLSGIGRFAMTRQIEGDQPIISAQIASGLTGEDLSA
ncbi:hypothetical protein N825_32100 [Skermanella stibiiresistens SB22]|uniref:Uncharacterized protein n=1 Tax=Skermanella stibiiresistens SB22 TaxID=1385369 RepID=W9GQ87_9PROT|nr:hypothetical protein N825_32100 [Skermanella stibiiresistens SB22]